MNRRLVALSLSVVAALVVAGCGGSDDSSRTRNNALINVNVGNTNFTFVVDCFQDEAARASAKASADEYWNGKIKNLEEELTSVNNIEVMPALSISPGPREEFADDAAYEAEVARLQADYESAKALEDAQSKSKAEQIARITADLDLLKTKRQEDLDRIDAGQLCVGDPGAGGEPSNSNPDLQPCVTSAPADLAGSGDTKNLTLRVCDEAKRLSIQMYDVSYNSLNGSEQPLSDGTNRTFTYEVTTETAGFKTVACADTGYLNSSFISVNGQSVTTQQIDESTEPIVLDFCRGSVAAAGSQTGNGGNGGNGNIGGNGGNGGNGGSTNQLPTTDDGKLDQAAIRTLAESCGNAVSFEVIEMMDKDNTYTATEPLLVRAALGCQIATPQLERIELYVKAREVDNRNGNQLFGNAESTTSTSGDVEFTLTEGSWMVKSVFRLIFKIENGNFMALDLASAEKELMVGPSFDDPKKCTPTMFTLSTVIDDTKMLSANCDFVKYGLQAVSSTFEDSISPDGTWKDRLLPVEHKIGSKVLVHYVSGGRGFSFFSSQLLSCDGDCPAGTLDENVTLTRNGDQVTMSAKDRCATKGPQFGTLVTASPFIELQPDLLLRQEAEDAVDMRYVSNDVSLPEDLANRTSVKTGAEWFWVASACMVNGEYPKDVSQIIDPQQWLVRLSDAPVTGGTEAVADTTSTPTAAPPAIPISNIVRDGALVVPSGINAITVAPTDMAALLDILELDGAQFAIGFDSGALIPLSLVTPKHISIPTGAKVLKLAVEDSGSEPTVTEYPVQRIEPVDVATGDVEVDNSGGSNMWLYAVIAVVVLLLLTFMVRRRRTAGDNEVSVN